MRRNNKKYQTEEVSYRATIDTEKLHNHAGNVVLLIDVVNELFAKLLNQVTVGLEPTDLIRFCIRADGLDKPISTCLIPVSEMTVERLLATIVKVLQSKESIQVDAVFEVDVLAIKSPVRKGKHFVSNKQNS